MSHLTPQFPPTAIQAEQILLGRLILAGASALTEIGALTPDQFADPLHGTLYRVVVLSFSGSKPSSRSTPRRWPRKSKDPAASMT